MTAMQDYSHQAMRFLLRRRVWVRVLAVLVVMLALLYVGFVPILPVDHDEVEHAHAAFKMLSGKIPYRDFYQNHFPAYWLLSVRLIRAFPFSVNAILAGRAVNLLALAACWVLGLRLLKSVRGGCTWLGLSAYTFAIATLACEMYFHTARPDPLMTLAATAGLCLIPLQGSISNARALLLGLLFGLAFAVSPKAAPMVLVVPALTVLICLREWRLRPAAALLPYGLGLGMAVLPTAWWVFRNGLFDAFCFDVFDLNRSLAKPWLLSITYLLIPVLLASILGALAQLEACKRRRSAYSNAPLIIALAMAAGIALALLSRHSAPYNLQILLVPAAVAFAGLVLRLCLQMRSQAYQLLLCAALLGYPAVHFETTLSRLKNDTDAIPLRDLQALINLARPGNRTCTAFSPAHPIFCQDVSGLSNSWDLFFAESLRSPRQLERFRGLWHDGIRGTISAKPDIILRRSPYNCWERALKAGLITPKEVGQLDALLPSYRILRLGPREIWVRRPRQGRSLPAASSPADSDKTQ